MEDSNKLIERGFELHKKGKVKEALGLYSEALSSQNSNPKLLFLVGLANLQTSNFVGAIDFFQKTISLDPNNYGAYNNLGAAYQNLNQFNEAINIYKKLILIKPDFSEAYNNLGNCLVKLNNFNGAIKNFSKAIELNPKNFISLANLANTQKEIFKFEDAINNYKKSISLNNNYLLAINNLANTYHELRRYNEALENYRKVFEINKNYKFLLGRLIHCQMYLSDWRDFDDTINSLTSSLKHKTKVCAPFVALSSFDNPELHKVCAEIYANEKSSELDTPPIEHKIKDNEKYKIGYFSPDFRNHPVLHLIRDVFKNHDKSKFEIYGFSFEPNKNDKMTEEIKKDFFEFIEVKDMSAEKIRNICRKKGLNIAIDLCGFTNFNRFEIFTHRLAPIQINYLGYPGTMASKYFDYIIADKTIIPEEETVNYSEQVVYLPNCYQPNSNYKGVDINSVKRNEYNLPNDKLIFCNLGSNHKITPEVFNSWMNILKKVPNSILLLLKPNEYAIDNIEDETTKRGINKERIFFAESLPHNDHLKRLKLADIFLDTFPYNAHTTASDAIRMGLPIITLSGRSFASRVCTSILKQVKMEKLSASSLKNYEEMAIQLGNDQKKLNQIKKEIKDNCLNSPLFRVQDFTKDLEKIFLKLIQKT